MEMLKKRKDFLFEKPQILRRIVKLGFAAGDGIHKGRLQKSAPVVGAQRDHDVIRLEGKIVGFAGTPIFFRRFPCLRPADLIVEPGKAAMGVVVPAAVNAPAALGNQLILCVQLVGDETGIVVGSVEAHGHPLHEGTRATAAFAAGQAIADKLDFALAGSKRLQHTVRPALEQYASGSAVVFEGLAFFDNLDPVNRIRVQVEEHAVPVLSGQRSEGLCPKPIHLKRKIGLVFVIGAADLHFQRSAADVHFSRSGAPEHGKALLNRVEAAGKADHRMIADGKGLHEEETLLKTVRLKTAVRFSRLLYRILGRMKSIFSAVFNIKRL